MYSLIGRLFDGKPLNIITIGPMPSFIIEPDIFLIGALLAAGLFVLVLRIRSQKSQALILIASGLAFSVAAYLVQTYMSAWFPELFIPGGPYGTWYGFRNDLSVILKYIAILIGVLVPAGFLVPRLRLSAGWRYLLLLGTLIATAILYYSYVFSVTMTPGSDISLPGWIPAISPFLASVAIATGVLGYFLILQEIFDRAASWPVRIIFIAAVTASAIVITYQTAVAVYAVTAWLMIAKFMDQRIRPGVLCVLAGGMAGLGIVCEIVGSYFAAMGPDAGRFVPVWVFPLVFMALVTLVPGPRILPGIKPDFRTLAVFGVTWGTGMLIALLSAVFPAGIFIQPDLLPQAPGSLAVNVVLGAGVAAILYYLLLRLLKSGSCRGNGQKSFKRSE